MTVEGQAEYRIRRYIQLDVLQSRFGIVDDLEGLNDGDVVLL